MHLKEPRMLVYIMARRTVDEVINVVFQVKNGHSFLKNKIQSAVFAFVSGSNRIQVKYVTDLLCSWLVYVKTNYLVCI
jgi:hypothetical protein